jgi:hypothetical protein
MQFDKVTGYIRKGIAEGATLVTGGAERPDGFTKGCVASHPPTWQLCDAFMVALGFSRLWNAAVWGPTQKPQSHLFPSQSLAPQRRLYFPKNSCA